MGRRDLCSRLVLWRYPAGLIALDIEICIFRFLYPRISVFRYFSFSEAVLRHSSLVTSVLIADLLPDGHDRRGGRELAFG